MARDFIMKKCPKCGSERIATISYGLPPVDMELVKMDEEIAQKIKNEEICLGGCVVPNRPPRFHCFKCRANFGTPPVVSSRYGEEDYRDIVTAIYFHNGGYFGGYDTVHIQKTESGIVVDVDFIDISIHPQNDGIHCQYAITDNRWKRLLDRLFCKLCVHEWKKRYVDSSVLDGEVWSLGFRLTHNRVHNWAGSNAFPIYWNELKRTFKPFLDKLKNVELKKPPYIDFL